MNTHEIIQMESFVVPAGTGTVAVKTPSDWLVGWHVWLQGADGSVVLEVTGQNRHSISVIRADLTANPSAGVTINEPLTLASLPYPATNPGAEAQEFIPVSAVNRVEVTVPTGLNTIELVTEIAEQNNPDYYVPGMTIFVQEVGWFEVISRSVGVATIDGDPYIPCHRLLVRVAALIDGITAGIDAIPNGAIFYADTYEVTRAMTDALFGSAYFDLALHQLGPYNSGEAIAITGENENTDPDAVYGEVNAGQFVVNKTGVYMVEVFLRTANAYETRPATQAAILKGVNPVAFGPYGTIVNGDRMTLTVSKMLTLEEGDVISPTWYDQVDDSTALSIEISGGSPSILSKMTITYIREA